MSSAKFTNRQTPTVMFANCGQTGQEKHRELEDCKILSYISAGQGRSDVPPRPPYYFSNQIRNLIIGDILAVYKSKIGFVGIARVISKPMNITNAYLEGKKVEKSMFISKVMFNESDNPGYEECLVEIKWLTKVHLGNQKRSGACFGIFKSQLATCSLDNQIYLKQELEKFYKINFRQLLEQPIIEPTIIFPNGDEELTFLEGAEKFRLHKFKERDKALVKLAKERHYQNDKKLCCQVCNFSFVDNYGDIGEGFIEAHHIYPISQLTEETENKIDDLILVCSNCHRMLHRQRPWITLEPLKYMIQKTDI